MKLFREQHMHDHGDEIIRLQSVQNAEHVQENDLVQLFRSNKYVIKMSTYSFSLLLMYLQYSNFICLLSILNQYINVKVTQGNPQKIVEYQGYSQTDSSKLKPFYNGIFEDQRKFYEKPEEEEEPEDSMDIDGDNKKRKKEYKKKYQSKRKKKLEEENEEVIINKLSFPSLGEEIEKSWLDDLKSRANLSNTSLPSICFYTVFNASDSLNTCTLANDGSLFATGYNDSSIKVWDLEGTNSKWYKAYKEYLSMDGRDSKYNFNLDDPRKNYIELVGHTQPIYGLDFSLDNRYLLSSSSDGTVRLWSMETRTNVVCYRGHIFPVWDTKFSPFGYYFATASYDKTVRLWTTNNTFPVRIFVGHVADANVVDFHPNSHYLLSGSADKCLKFWEIESGECLRTFSGHLGPINCVSISSDGRSIVSGGDDKDLIVWDLNSGKKVATLKGHEDSIWSVDISGEGNIIASGSADCSVRLWDLRMLQEMKKKDTDILDTTQNKKSLGVYYTRQTPVIKVSFTRRNLLLAAGPFKSSIQQ